MTLQRRRIPAAWVAALLLSGCGNSSPAQGFGDDSSGRSGASSGAQGGSGKGNGGGGDVDGRASDADDVGTSDGGGSGSSGADAIPVPGLAGIDAGTGDGSIGASDAGGPGPGVLSGKGTLVDPFGWASVTRDGRNYIVQNNVWGGHSSQTVSYEGTTFDVTAQSGANPTNGAPVSFPSVFIGSNNQRSSTGSNVPKLVSALTTVPTTWTNNAGGPPGTYDAAYDVWFSTSAGGDPASPTGGFLMVWYYKPAMARPIGSVMASAVTIAGASGSWDVWIGKNGAVPCISYVRTQSIPSMTYDLNAFIQDAVKKRAGTIQAGWYLTNVFAGFEIWSGGQGLRTTSFSAVVN